MKLTFQLSNTSNNPEFFPRSHFTFHWFLSNRLVKDERKNINGGEIHWKLLNDRLCSYIIIANLWTKWIKLKYYFH